MNEECHVATVSRAGNAAQAWICLDDQPPRGYVEVPWTGPPCQQGGWAVGVLDSLPGEKEGHGKARVIREAARL
jgi:hypothetical protein